MLDKIKNRLINGNEVVMDLPPSSPKLKGWLAIYPIKVGDLGSFTALKTEYNEVDALTTKEKWAYRMLCFEVQDEYIENEWDVSEEEMINKRANIVFGYDALMKELRGRNLDTNLLTEPWKTDYPL